MKLPRFPHEVRRGSVTVRIYRLERSATKVRAARRIFTVAWHAGGVRKTKQFAEFSAALEEARLKADQLAAGKVAAAELTADDAGTIAAARRIGGNVPIIAALEEWANARELCGGNLMAVAKAWREANVAGTKSITVPDAVDAFLAAKDRAGVDTSASYRTILPRLQDVFRGRAIASVSARELDAWIHGTFRSGDGKHAHPVTFNTARKRLVALWRWCRKQGYLPRAAQTEAEQIDSAREPDQDIGILTVSDFARILEVVRVEHPDHLAVTVLAGFCGLRRSELHEQKWSDVHLDRGFVRVTKAKRNTPAKRLVPLSAAAVEWLMLCDRSPAPAGSNAEEKARRDRVSPPWGVDRVRAFARQAKIPCPENGFRHGFISHRVAQTGNVAETALEAGNSPAVVHKHYRELVVKADGQRWFDLCPATVRAIARNFVAVA